MQQLTEDIKKVQEEGKAIDSQLLVKVDEYLDRNDIPFNVLANDVKSKSLNAYTTVINYEHARNEPILSLKNLILLAPLLLLLAVSGVGAAVYIEPSKEAAENKFEEFVNPSSSFLVNFFINLYFAIIMTMPLTKKLIDRLPQKVTNAIFFLEEKENTCTAKMGRIAKGAGIVALNLGPAAMASFPMWALDKKFESDFHAAMVFGASIPLMYKSAESIINILIPTVITNPYNFIKRKMSHEAVINHEVSKTTSAFRQSFIEALEAGIAEILKRLQTGDTASLMPIFELLTKENPTPEDTLKLIFKILMLAPPPKHRYTYNEWSITAAQAMMCILTVYSLWGLYPVTREGTDYAFGIHNKIISHLVASVVFGFSSAIAFVVGPYVAKVFYQIVAYFLNGANKAWKNSASASEFFHKAWQNKANMAAWYDLVQLPLPFIQNLKTMLSIDTIFVPLSYYSTKTMTLLNPKLFAIPTVIAVAAFNFNPVPIIIGAVQAITVLLFAKWVASLQGKADQIRLLNFINATIDFTTYVTDSRFLEILNDIVGNERLVHGFAEICLHLFSDKKNSSEIFGEDHIFAGTKLSTIIQRITKKELSDLRYIGLFRDQGGAKNQEDEQNYLLKEGGFSGRSLMPMA